MESLASLTSVNLSRNDIRGNDADLYKRRARRLSIDLTGRSFRNGVHVDRSLTGSLTGNVMVIADASEIIASSSERVCIHFDLSGSMHALWNVDVANS